LISNKFEGERPLTICNSKVKIIEKALLNVLELQLEGYVSIEEIKESEYIAKDKNFIKIVNKRNNFVFYKKVTIIKKVFFDHSYGFRSNKSAHECLNDIKHCVT
jgi:hypothetical protein